MFWTTSCQKVLQAVKKSCKLSSCLDMYWNALGLKNTTCMSQSCCTHLFWFSKSQTFIFFLIFFNLILFYFKKKICKIDENWWFHNLTRSPPTHTFYVKGQPKNLDFWYFCSDVVTNSGNKVIETKNPEAELQGLVYFAKLSIVR